MVAPAVAAAAIQVGGNILGGLFGNAKAKRERQQAIDDQRLQYVRLREAAELAGFNPLAVLGNAAPIMTPQVVPSTDYMGSAIADSAMLLAQNLATSGKAATAAKLNQYQTQNSRLQKQVENLTLRPDVPGVYARNAARAAAGGMGNGGASGRSADTGGSGVLPDRGGSDRNGVTPDRKSVTTQYLSFGTSTDLPQGPDPEEIVSGALIDANNKRKARLAFENSDEARAGMSQRFRRFDPFSFKPGRAIGGQEMRFNPKMPKYRRVYPTNDQSAYFGF